MLERIKKINDSVNEWSYKRFARFYDVVEFNDKEFEEKLSKIEWLINMENCTDINFIAQDTNCTYEECIIKIRYLKNKRIIGDYYIDTVEGKIYKCSSEDTELLCKYKPYIYNFHYQIDDIVLKMPNTSLHSDVPEGKDDSENVVVKTY